MAELPSGTVTFLFTDIEGSTRLLKQLREAYADVLADHHRLIREAVTAAGGEEIDTQGDALFFAFRRARDAVAGAVAAQRALAAHAWPDGTTLRVRMGIHTGEPVVGTERYVGLGVHRGARICAAAHGGQILLSNTTRDLVEDELPFDVHVRDLGEHELKDIDRPERLFQLDVDGLPHEFPPPRTKRGDADALVRGRERELAERARAAMVRPVGLARRRPLVVGALGLLVAGGIAAIVVLASGSNASANGIPADSVGLVDARSDQIRKTVDINKSPFGVAVGEGAVWITNANDGTVSRVDPRTGSVVASIPVGNTPSGIVVGGGSVWVANHDDATVSRISPRTNAQVQVIPVGDGPTAVAFGEGSVWVTNANDRTISRIDPATGHSSTEIKTDAVGRGIAVGGGSVWVTDESTRTVARIDPGSNAVVGTVPVGNGPSGIGFGAGAVWVANSLDGTVSRIDPASGSVTGLVHVGGAPDGVAVGKNVVWVSSEFDERLVRIDPNALRIAKSVGVDNRPKGVAVDDRGSCWVAVQASGRGHYGGRLVVLGAEIDTMDPVVPSSNLDALAEGLVYDGLTAPRRTGGADGTQIVPDLAADLPVPTNEGRTYTFRIRRDIRYSNGLVVKPADFRRGIERAFSVEPDWATTLGIVGSAACRKGRRCDLSRGVVVGPDSVTIRLSVPDRRFLLNLSLVPPVPPGTPMTGSAPARPPIGTGPYRVEDFVPNREVTLVRNPHFHVWSAAARPKGYPDEIAMRVTSNRSAASNKAIEAVVAGRADIFLQDVPLDRVAELKARFPDQLHLVPQSSIFFVYLNTKRPPFDDVRVRRALNFAVDRGKVVSLRGGSDLAQQTCNVVPRIVPGYSPYCPYTVEPDAAGDWKAPDLGRARALVAASGTRGERVVVWTFPFLAKEGRYIAALLRRLGYRASVKELPDLTTYFTAITKARPQAGLAGWLGLHSPENIFDALSCGYVGNWAQFCDPAVDAQARRLRREGGGNTAAASRLAAQIERRLVDEAPWVPLFNPKIPDFVSKRVGNYQYNAYDFGVLLDQLWVR